MEKLKAIAEDKKLTWLLLMMGALVIFAYYIRKVPMIYTVWELVDEYGYLANAAYLSGNKWPYVTNYYYGYGYSLLLMPLFWFCNSGITIIRGAIVVNIIMAVLLFLVQYALMAKLCKNCNRNLLVIISFILCFYPYIVASELKVLCEVLLTLLVWVCALLFYQALDTGKWYYYVLLAVSTVYMFFVHTRAFVYGGVLVAIAILLLLFKKIKWKQFLLAFGIAVITLIVGFVVKNQVIQNVYVKETAQEIQESILATVEEYTGDCMVTSALEGIENTAESVIDTELVTEHIVGENIEETIAEETITEETNMVQTENVVHNTVQFSYIVERILNIFTNFSIMYVYGFACRNFYLFVGTCGMFHIGVAVSCKDAWKEWREKKSLGAENGIKFMLAMAAVMAVLATVVQNPYSLDRPAYNFYGRYYEYMIGPMAFIGLAYCTKKKMPWAGKIAWLSVLGLSYLGTIKIADYLEVPYLYFDSARIAAFSCFAHTERYALIVQAAAVTAIIAALVILVLNHGKWLRVLIPIVLMCLFLHNNRLIIKNILGIQADNADDLGLVTYIAENYGVDEIYFLNPGEPNEVTYADLQPLFGKVKVLDLAGEDNNTLKKGDIFLSIHYNPYTLEIEHPLKSIYETTYYRLYEVVGD